MVSGLKLNPFEFIFVYGIRYVFSFILLHVDIQFSQYYLLKIPSFSHCVFLLTLSKTQFSCSVVSDSL